MRTRKLVWVDGYLMTHGDLDLLRESGVHIEHINTISIVWGGRTLASACVDMRSPAGKFITYYTHTVPDETAAYREVTFLLDELGIPLLT